MTDSTTKNTPPLGAGGLRVTQIQMDIRWGDIAANCAEASRLIDSAPGSDLYVLPEMFSTGFATEPKGIADDSLQTLKWMQQKANAINAAICGSVATADPTLTLSQGEGKIRYYNRLYFVTPQHNKTIPPSGDRELSFYDKHHLFTYGNEHLRYTAGKDRVIVEWRGVRFLLQICYDLRFPVFSRNVPRPTDKVYPQSAYEDYQKSTPFGGWGAIIYVASWPTSRIEPWRALLKARAIENQCYVLGVDRVGEDPACSYCGGTECIDPYGKVIAACPDNQITTITTTLDMEDLQRFRQKFPVLSDADAFTMHNA